MLAIYLKREKGKKFRRVPSDKATNGPSCKTELYVRQDVYKIFLGRSFGDAFKIQDENHLKRSMTKEDLDETIGFIECMIKDAMAIFSRHAEVDLSDVFDDNKKKSKNFCQWVEKVLCPEVNEDGWQSYIDDLEIAIEFCQYAKSQVLEESPAIIIEFVP